MKKQTDQQKQLHIPLICRDIIRNGWLVILAGIIAAVGVFAYGNLLHKPEYTSVVTFSISPKSSGSYVGFYSSLNTATEMAEVFKEVFSSDVLKRLIQEDLQNPDLEVNVTAAVQQGTNILRVTTTADTPVGAHLVMESVLRNYGKVSGYLFGGVVLDAIRSPHVPTAPANPFNMKVMLLLGVCGAMCAMAGGIGLLSYHRKTVKTLEGAREYMEEAPLGVLIREKQRRKSTVKGLLITRTAISFRYVEAMLQIAHKVRHKMRKSDRKVLLITSVAENEGKSTVAANLAIAMAKHGSRVALVDMDMRRPAIHKLFSELGEGHDLMQCLKNGLPENLQDHPLQLFTMSGAYQNVSQLLHGDQVDRLLQDLRQEMDFVILDTPPYMAVADTGMLLKFVDASLMILRQDWVPGPVLKAVTRELEESKPEYLGYVVNHYIDDGTGFTRHKYYDKYSPYGGYAREEQL